MATITNLVPNPSLEVDLTGWSAVAVSGSNSISRVTSQHYSGAAAMSMVNPGGSSVRATTPTGTAGIPVTTGHVYTASAYFKADTTAGTMRVVLRWYDASGAEVNTTTAATINNNNSTWTRHTVTGTASGGAIYCAVEVGSPAGTTAGTIHYVDAIMLVEGTTVYDYFDGSTPDVIPIQTFSWVGTPHNSSSTLVYGGASGFEAFLI